MSRQFGDNTPRPMDDPPPDDRKRELLKEVLSATFDAKHPTDPAAQSRYQQVVDRWRGTPWNEETIGIELVSAALRDWVNSVRLIHTAQEQLIREITHALFEDPCASIRLKSWWQELQESNK